MVTVSIYLPQTLQEIRALPLAPVMGSGCWKVTGSPGVWAWQSTDAPQSSHVRQWEVPFLSHAEPTWEWVQLTCVQYSRHWSSAKQ